MKIFVCGSRGFVDKSRINKILSVYVDSGDTILEGCCKNSADEVAEQFGRLNNVEVEHFPANGLPLVRNKKMAKACDICVAFWDGNSFGTAHSIASVVSLGKVCQVIMV